MTGFRTVLAWLLVAALALAAPMAVAAHGASHVPDSGAHHHAGHSHVELYHVDRHDEDGDSDQGRPALPYHDQTVADHSHQTAGLVRAQTIERPSRQRHWRLASDAEIRFDAPFRLERPPRS